MFGLGEDVVGGAQGGISIETMADWDQFAKAAATSTYETDHAALTGMSALRKESLEPTLRAIVAQDDTFSFLKALKRQPVTSAIHEWMVQISRGGQVDGMNISELGEIQFDVGDYRRKVERLKLFATGAKISDFANSQGLVPDTLRARENENATVRLSNAVERSLFVSNEKYSPNKINGFRAQVENFDGGANVRDLGGTSDVAELVNELFQIKADVRQEGVYGDVSDIFLDSYIQNDLDQNLMPQYRVQLDNNPNSLQYGAPVGGIKTSYGNIGLKQTIWNNNNANTQAQVVKSKGKVPDKIPPTATLTVTPVGSAPGSVAGWTADRAGIYYYSVALVDADGREGLLSTIQGGTVATAGALRLTGQAAPSSVTATGGRVYRSTQAPAAVPVAADLRLAGEFVVEADGSFVFIDVNQDIPGSSTIPVMNLKPQSIQWLQLKPMTQFPLAATNSLIIPWAVALYGTLMLGMPQHHFFVKNYLPKNPKWKPFKTVA